MLHLMREVKLLLVPKNETWEVVRPDVDSLVYGVVKDNSDQRGGGYPEGKFYAVNEISLKVTTYSIGLPPGWRFATEEDQERLFLIPPTTMTICL